MYDILLPLSPPHANPILVPQPPPHLPSLFPKPSKPLPPHLDFLNKPPTTYIGQVPLIPLLEAGPLDDTRETHRSAPKQPTTPQRPLFYALSSSKYPLINLAPPPRPGAFANGTFALSEDLPERDQLLPYLLDPPSETRSDSLATRDVQDVLPVDPKAGSGQGWAWPVNALGAMLFLVGSMIAAALLWKKRRSGRPMPTQKEKVAKATVDEKTALLDGTKEKEVKRSVTFVEPALPTKDESTIDNTDNNESKKDSIEGAPKKKSTRRRVRGKKKPKTSGIVDEEQDDEGDEDGSPGNASDGATANAAKSPKKGEKPLPELPREMSAVDLTHLTPERHEGDDKERLSISDTVIGMSLPIPDGSQANG